jgi:phosphoglycolate phosphatase
MIKAIIFDLDDTLVDTRGPKFKAIQYTGQKFYHLDITDKILNDNYGKPIREFFSVIFNQVEPVDNILSNFMTVRDQFPSIPFPHTIETVGSLMQKYLVGVLTAASKKMVLSDLTAAGFPVEKFSFIQSADDTVYHKPDPRVFDPIKDHLQKQNINCSEIVFIGDSMRDYIAAKSAGILFYGITDRTTTYQEFNNNHINTISDITELPKLLDNLT